MNIILKVVWFINLAYALDSYFQTKVLKAKPYLSSANTKFGPYIEGTAVDPFGNIYAVNQGDNTTLTQLGSVSTNSLLYKDTNEQAWFNAIRFINKDEVLVGDARLHRVLKLIKKGKNYKPYEFCKNNTMLQPNDIAITSTGWIFTSGMRFVKDNQIGDGDLWRCGNFLKSNTATEVRKLEIFGRTNGIEVSPDEKFLYISEAFNQNGKPTSQKIWKYDLESTSGTIKNRKLFADFEKLDGSQQYDIDGMRTDIKGNLYVTRHGQSQVTILNSYGQIIGVIKLNIIKPTNLEFGGKYGTTLFIVGQCPEFHPIEGLGKGCVDYIELGVIGRAFFNLKVGKENTIDATHNDDVLIF